MTGPGNNKWLAVCRYVGSRRVWTPKSGGGELLVGAERYLPRCEEKGRAAPRLNLPVLVKVSRNTLCFAEV